MVSGPDILPGAPLRGCFHSLFPIIFFPFSLFLFINVTLFLRIRNAFTWFRNQTDMERFTAR